MTNTRAVLFTGKGGVGKTTIAGATAARIARDGRKTLVLSTDPAHSLADAFGVSVLAEPVEVSPGLFIGQVDAQQRLQEVWGELQSYLVTALGAAGLDSVRAEELTVLPGAEELLALIEVKDQVTSGRWDAVVVDCAPTAETLRLLSLPEALDWYLSKVLTPEARVVRALRPMLGPALGLPAPRPEVWTAAERLQAQLIDVQQVLQSAATTVRLVLTPETVVLAEARRARTQLALYGYTVDAVIANRVFEATDDPWRAAWAETQADQLDDAVGSFEPLPVLTCTYQSREPVGVDALTDLGEALYLDSDPLAASDATQFMQIRPEDDGYRLVLDLPLAKREAIELSRVGDDLVVTVSGRRRVLALPSALRRCHVSAAKVRDGALEIVFIRDPDQNPRTEAHP